MINKNYISKITQVLAKTDWTQAQLAQELGLTFATVNRWLKGHTKPHPAQLRAIDKLYKEYIGISPLAKKELQEALNRVTVKKRKISNIYSLLNKKVIREEFLLELTYNSDAIEGSTLTKKETEAVLFDKATIQDKSLVEHLEAINHAEILNDIFNEVYKTDISEALIQEIHRNLMKGIRDDAGLYAKHLRRIRGVDIALPYPEDIPEEMQLFCKKINKIEDCAISHVSRMHADFEAIHPFGDGNGRVGRLIMIIQLLNHGFAPCLISVQDKSQYYEYLEYAQKKSETHFIKYVAKSILKGYEIIEKLKQQ